MKKKFSLFILLLFIIVPAMFVFTGCDKKDETSKYMPRYINFYVNGYVYESVKIVGEGTLHMPTNPTKTNYVFEGWYFDNDVWEKPLTFQDGEKITLRGDVNVYAKWKFAICYVKFFADGVQVGETKNVSLNTELSDIPAVPEKAGYTGAWEELDFSCVQTDLNVNAVYTPKNYNITLNYNNADGGIAAESITATYNAEIGRLPTPTKGNLAFAGWYLCAEKFTADTVYNKTEDVCLTARWYMPDNGKNIILTTGFEVENNVYEFIVNQENNTVELNSNIRYSASTTKFNFNGKFVVSENATWSLYADALCTELIETREVDLTVSTTCYILLKNNVNNEQTIYTVTLKKNKLFNVSFFNLSVEMDLLQTTVEEGYKLIEPTLIPESGMSGYEFKCWSVSETAFENYNFASKVNSDIVLYACYENKNLVSTEGLTFEKLDGKAILTGVASTNVEHLVIPQIYYALPYGGAVEGVLAECVNLKTITLPFVGKAQDPENAKDAILGIMFGTTERTGTTKVDQRYTVTDTYSVYFPSELYGVTLLNDEVLSAFTFCDCSMLTQITLASNTRELGEYSLIGVGLTKLNIPASVTTLRSNVYSSSELLEIPETVVTYEVDSFDAPFVFYHLADGVKFVPYNYNSGESFAFGGKEYIYEDNVYYIIDENDKAAFAFYDGQEGTTYTFPSSIQGYTVTRIHNAVSLIAKGYYAFNIPDTITEIEAYAFSEVSDLALKLNFNNTTTLEKINNNAFEGAKLESHVWPTSLRYVGSQAFKGVTTLGEQKFSAGLEEVCSRAFEGSSIYVIYLPDTVTTTGGYLFANAKTKVLIAGDYESFDSTWTYEFAYPYEYSVENVKNYKLVNKGVYVTKNDETYYLRYIVEGGDFVLENKINNKPVTSIYWSYIGERGLDSFSFGLNNSITEVDSRHFSIAKKIIASPHIQKIVRDDLYYNSQNDVTTFVDLFDCQSLEIGNGAFKNFVALKEISIIMNGLVIKSIGSSAFSGCVELESLNITSSSITEISSYTFANCKKLESFTIPKHVTSIGSSAFENCDKLTSVTIPQSVTYIGAKAFKGSGLIHAYINGNVDFDIMSGINKIGTLDNSTSIMAARGLLALKDSYILKKNVD